MDITWTSSKSAALHLSILTISRLRHLVGRLRRALAHGPGQKYSVFFHFGPHILLIFTICPPDRLPGKFRFAGRSNPNRTERSAFGVTGRTEFGNSSPETLEL